MHYNNSNLDGKRLLCNISITKETNIIDTNIGMCVLERIPQSESVVIAVDGGGSTCRCVLASVSSEDKYIHTQTGAANVFSDFTSAIEHISLAIEQLAQQIDVSHEQIYRLPIYLGLAGAINQQIIDRVIDALPFSRIKVEDDHPAALKGALGNNDGAVAHLGTGSFFAIQQDGKGKFVGGWGHELGDDGSAYWLGREALRMTLWAKDRLIKRTPFSEAIEQQFNQRSDEVVRFVRHASVIEIADLAKLVIQYAQQDDPIASGIVRRSIALIIDILARIGWHKDLPLCLTGGLGKHYKPFFDREVQASIVEPQGQPIDGALMLAKEFWQVIES